jgi:hypothetical protein
VLLALGVNLLSSTIPLVFGLSDRLALALGVGLCLIGVLYFMLRVVTSLSRTTVMEGVLSLSEENEVVAIQRYRFSEEIKAHINGLTSENKALGRLWRQASLGVCYGEMDDAKRRVTDSANRLVCEAIEYFVLNELTLHLSEYFISGRRDNDKAVVHVERRDIPQLLLDNRFLELFSKDMSEREAFQDHGGDAVGKVVFATGLKGEIYDHFELVLPKGSTLRRNGSTLCIDTPRFVIDIDSVYEGFGTVLPSDFEAFYLGVPFHTVDSNQVNLRIAVRFRWWSAFSPRSWEYFAWLDSFLEKLYESFHFEAFLAKSGWHTAHTVAITVRNMRAAAPDAEGAHAAEPPVEH